MARVLRPGGQVALLCAAAPGYTEWFGLLDLLLQAAFGPHAERSAPDFPTWAEVTHLMLDAGLVMQHLANPVDVQRVGRPEAFVRLMSTVAPHWAANLSPEEQAGIEQWAIAVIRSAWPQGFSNTWSAVEAVGVKAV